LFDANILTQIKESVARRIKSDKSLLDELRQEVKILNGSVRVIQPRSTTAFSLVASDGGNNQLFFDPFMIQLIRVVDSYGKEFCIDTVSPMTDTDILSSAQFDSGAPKTVLGVMMRDLGVRELSELSPMIPSGREIRENPDKVKPRWVQVYRDLCEWAVLYDRICYQTFATDTLIVRDGLLRSMIFDKDLFITWRKKVEEAVERIKTEDKRNVYLVGIAKKSKVLTRYNLALMLENIMPSGDPCYVRVPREMEANAYVWPDYALGPETEGRGGMAPKYVAGDMYFVRFGSRAGDPVWTVDILSSQSENASKIFGYLLSDAVNGFPVPLYPRCLQAAHEYAQVNGFDLQIVQDEIYTAVRGVLSPQEQWVLDAFQFDGSDAF
jgi:hypothetical protein